MTPLPVDKVVIATAALLWERRIALCRTLIGPGLVLAALDTVTVRGQGFLAIIIYCIVSTVVTISFTVTCHRMIILGETAVPRYGPFSWTSRETRFLGWLLLNFIFVIVSAAFIGLLIGATATLSSFEQAQIIWIALLGLPAIYLLTRMSVLFPATAIGEQRNIRWAWKITSHNGLRLMATVAILPTVLLFIAGLIFPVHRYLLLDILLYLMMYAFEGLGIALLSVSFLFLTRSTLDEAAANDTVQPTDEKGG